MQHTVKSKTEFSKMLPSINVYSSSSSAFTLANIASVTVDGVPGTALHVTLHGTAQVLSGVTTTERATVLVLLQIETIVLVGVTIVIAAPDQAHRPAVSALARSAAVRVGFVAAVAVLFRGALSKRAFSLFGIQLADAQRAADRVELVAEVAGDWTFSLGAVEALHSGFASIFTESFSFKSIIIATASSVCESSTFTLRAVVVPLGEACPAGSCLSGQLTSIMAGLLTFMKGFKIVLVAPAALPVETFT